MTDMHIKLGGALLKSLVNIKEQKGNLSLEDVGDIFIQMASTLNPSISPVDQFAHKEIEKLVQYIAETKKEIFAIASNDKSEAAIMDASQHLDEVIKATEEASNIIMDAADAIQNAATGIGGDKEQQIMEATNRVYEACNFQDITGQRITKVIKLLENIEARISKLNGMFTHEQPEADAKTPANDSIDMSKIDEKDLLNGPQLSGKASSQADVDALFASLGGKS